MGEALTALSDKIFLAADHPEQAARQVAGLIALGRSSAPMRCGQP